MKISRKASSSSTSSLADRIRLARRKSDLSQTALAQRLGVSASAVAQWEHPSGTAPSLQHVMSLTEEAGVSLDWLVTGSASRAGTRAGASAEVPALTLDVYARTLEEEGLLESFRRIPVKKRVLLLALADEFARPQRLVGNKRR